MRLAAVAALLGTCCSVALAEVNIEPAGQGFVAQTPSYEAAIGADGCLTSLKVGGQEFLLADDSFPRGGYAYLDSILAVPNPACQGTAVTAQSDQAVLGYEFSDDAVTLTFANRTDRAMQYVVVFAKEVTAVCGGDRRFRKTPTEASCNSATYFRLPAKLTIGVPQHIWGPWGDGYQVMTTPVSAGQTSTITFAAGTATAEEQQKAEVAMNQVSVPPTDPQGPMWDLGRFGKTPHYEPATGFEWAETAEGVQPIFLDGPPLEGKPTKVFAWLGVPAHEPRQKLPGIVLVHGGGGGAFAHWVKMWNDRGYAAIAMDTCGCVPVGSYGNWQHYEHGGPEGWGGFAQLDRAREDQWSFHAIAAIMLSHSLLRSLPDVDPARIGVTGVSWGGYLTSLVAGVDPRFAFAAPVYGCGFTMDMTFADSLKGLQPELRDRWMRWWDPSAYLKEARMPMLWVNGTNDFAYTMNGWQKSYREAPGPHWLSLRLRMEHGHIQGEAPEEIHAFADQVLKGGVPLCRITGQGRDGNAAWVTFAAGAPVVQAELCYTTSRGPWTERPWETAPAQLAEGRATANLPDGTACYYFNFTDERKLIVSSEHEELPAGG